MRPLSPSARLLCWGHAPRVRSLRSQQRFFAAVADSVRYVRVDLALTLPVFDDLADPTMSSSLAVAMQGPKPVLLLPDLAHEQPLSPHLWTIWEYAPATQASVVLAKGRCCERSMLWTVLLVES